MAKEIKFGTPAYEWNPVQEKTYSIQIRCWSRDEISEIKRVWNVYALIFDGHPLFNELERAKNLPFHGGCTYDKNITTEHAMPESERASWMRTSRCLKVGSDYSHYLDDYFESADPSEGVPFEIQKDVQELADALAGAVPPIPAPKLEEE